MPIRPFSAFTLVELIIVITLIAILSAVGFLSYANYLLDARDTSRWADLGNLKVQLRSEFQKRWAYPYPGSPSYSLAYSGVSNVLAIQGWANQEVNLGKTDMAPKDPSSQTYYGYAITPSKQAYQVIGTLENGGTPMAYVDGDFKTVSKDMLPGLSLALDMPNGSVVQISPAIGSGATNQRKFITRNSVSNLLYKPGASGAVSTESSFANILAGYVPQNTSYADCLEIFQSGNSYGSGVYQVRSSTGAISNTGCLMNY